jgi:hypothetical protein
MGTLEAVVKNGRLILDEPTELPDGTVVRLMPEDPFADMPDDERERLHAILDQSLEDARANRGMPAEEFFAHLRAR